MIFISHYTCLSCCCPLYNCCNICNVKLKPNGWKIDDLNTKTFFKVLWYLLTLVLLCQWEMVLWTGWKVLLTSIACRKVLNTKPGFIVRNSKHLLHFIFLLSTVLQIKNLDESAIKLQSMIFLGSNEANIRQLLLKNNFSSCLFLNYVFLFCGIGFILIEVSL